MAQILSSSRPIATGSLVRLARTGDWRDPCILLVLLALAPIVIDPYRVITLGSFLPYAMAAAALSLVWGYCGVLSIGQAAFYGLGAYAAAKSLAGRDVLPGLSLGLVAAIVLAGALGWVLARMSFGPRAGPFLVAVITFCAAAIFHQFAVELTGFTGGFNGLSITQHVLPVDRNTAYYVMFAAFALVLLTLVVVARSDAGRAVLAVRDNANRLRYFGTNVDAVRLRIFVVGAVVTAFAGVLDALYNGVASPDKAGFEFSTQILLWCAIGGRTSLTGAAIGALVVNVGGNELSAQIVNYWQIVLGIAFIVVVLFVPDGIYWPLRRLGRRIEIADSAEISRAPEHPAAHHGEVKVLEARSLEQRFGSFKALDIERLDLRSGQITALIGPNGAGKSTLVGALSGGLPDAKGEARILGREIMGLPAHTVAGLGLRRKFQAPNVFETLTVGENLRIGSQKTARGLMVALRRSRSLLLTMDVERLLAASGLSRKLDTTAAALSHGEKQFLEICMVLDSNPAIVLLDEPTAGLSAGERAEIGRLLRALVVEGAAVLLIEHDFGFIREVSDRILVMHQGSIIADGSVATVSADVSVRELYVGGAR